MCERLGEIDITPKMIKAGEMELAGYGPNHYDSDETVVCNIFIAMIAASGARSAQITSGEKAPPTSRARRRSGRAKQAL